MLVCDLRGGIPSSPPGTEAGMSTLREWRTVREQEPRTLRDQRGADEVLV